MSNGYTVKFRYYDHLKLGQLIYQKPYLQRLSYSFLRFLHLMYFWVKTTFGTVQKWSLRPLLDSPKGGLNIGILLYLCKLSKNLLNGSGDTVPKRKSCSAIWLFSELWLTTSKNYTHQYRIISSACHTDITCKIGKNVLTGSETMTHKELWWPRKMSSTPKSIWATPKHIPSIYSCKFSKNLPLFGSGNTMHTRRLHVDL